MPSHRREEAGPAQVQLQLQQHAQFTSYSLSCAPQAHCRSESVSTYNPLAPLVVDMDSWSPASGFEASVRNCGSPPVQTFQQAPEKPMGSSTPLDNDDDDDDISGINAGTVFPQLADFQSETWWPPITVQAIPRDTSASQHASCVNVNPAGNVTFATTAGYSMESWCHDSIISSGPVVAVANADSMRDLNAPMSDHPSAMAVVRVAPSAASGVPVAVPNATRAKLGARKGQHKGKSVSAPTSPSELRPPKEKNLGVQKSGKWNGKRPVSQRENHIWSERQRRKGMNYLFSTLRSLLPHPTSKTDKSTVVGEIIKYIQELQGRLEMLTKKRQQMIAARTLHAFHSNMETQLPKAFVSNGLTLVDHSRDPSSMTAITALPPPGSESCLQSYLGVNVGLHVCGLNVFITTSSPRGRRGLLQQLLVTIHKHELDVINANISTSNASIFHCLHCQASQDAELLNNDLHSALQRVITNFEGPPF